MQSINSREIIIYKPIHNTMEDFSKDELLMLKKIEELRTELTSVRKELKDLRDDYEADSIAFFGASPTGWNTLDNEEGKMNGWER